MSAEGLVERLLKCEPRALPRLATLVENEDPVGLQTIDLLFPQTGQAHIVGITGPPGVGKSTLVAALIERMRSENRLVAVIAVDPSSSVSGGAILGDRIRMMDRHADPGVFVRSMASRGRQGGLAWATANMVHLLDAAGFPNIIVETVGTGQDGTDVAHLADTVVVAEAPGLGDGVQAIKSGLLEIGDVVVVNKADLPGADDAIRLLRASFEMARQRARRRVPILGVSSTTGRGIEELVDAIDAHCTWLLDSGEREARRTRSARTEVLVGLRLALNRRLQDRSEADSQLSELIDCVVRRELSPGRAVDLITRKLVSSDRS